MEIRKSRPWNWFRSERGAEWPQEGAITPWYGSVPSLSELRRGIDRVFDDLSHGWGWQMERMANENKPLRPSLNIASTDRHYRITVEIPGIREKDISLEAGDDTLIIRGEKKQETKEEKEDVYCSECSYGMFERVLSLPEDADADKIDASFKNGLLTITIPRRKKAKGSSRDISIRTAA